MPGLRPIEIERLRYWQGQALHSGDARREVATNAQLRWWHTRAAHGAFGVATGLEVTLAGTTVTVQPGLAIDGYGREIAVVAPATILAPDTALAGDATLIVSAAPPASGACHRGNAVLRWVPPREVDVCSGVPLVRWLKGDSPSPSPLRFYARPMARPRIASGATIAAGTRWATWSEGGRLIGFQTAIDTSAAGFTQTPCYFAALDVRRSLVPQPADAFETFTPAAALLLLACSHVADASMKRFLVRTVVPQALAPARSTSPLLAAMRQRVTVRWMAVEPVSVAAPTEVNQQ